MMSLVRSSAHKSVDEKTSANMLKAARAEIGPLGVTGQLVHFLPLSIVHVNSKYCV